MLVTRLIVVSVACYRVPVYVYIIPGKILLEELMSRYDTGYSIRRGLLGRAGREGG